MLSILLTNVYSDKTSDPKIEVYSDFIRKKGSRTKTNGKIEVSGVGLAYAINEIAEKSIQRDFVSVNYEYVKALASNRLTLVMTPMPFMKGFPYTDFVCSTGESIRNDTEILISTRHFMIVRPVRNIVNYLKIYLDDVNPQNAVELFKLTFSVFRQYIRMSKIDRAKITKLWAMFEKTEKISNKAQATYPNEAIVAYRILGEQTNKIFQELITK
jgi:hypothetical protein